jgi:hypothetical protein
MKVSRNWHNKYFVTVYRMLRNELSDYEMSKKVPAGTQKANSDHVTATQEKL